MFLAVDVLPDGFLVFVDATAMCWYFIWTRGYCNCHSCGLCRVWDVIGFHPFEQDISSIWARYYEKTFLCFQFLIRLYTRILFRQGFPHFVQLTHCYWWEYQVWLILWNRRYLFSSPAFNDGVFVSRSSTSGGGRRRSDCCALLGRCQIGHTNLCSQSSIRFVRLKLSKTLPKTPHLFTTYLIPSYFSCFSYFFSLPIFIVSMTFEVSIAPMFQELKCNSLN